MTDRLIDRYAALERRMMEADERGDEQSADSLRDLMDPIWYQLTDEEHAFLNGRGHLSLAVLYPITFSISAEVFFMEMPRSTAYEKDRNEPWVSTDWRKGAA